MNPVLIPSSQAYINLTNWRNSEVHPPTLAAKKVLSEVPYILLTITSSVELVAYHALAFAAAIAKKQTRIEYKKSISYQKAQIALMTLELSIKNILWNVTKSKLPSLYPLNDNDQKKDFSLPPSLQKKKTKESNPSEPKPKNIPVNTDEDSEKRLIKKLESIKFDQKQNGEKKDDSLPPSLQKKKTTESKPSEPKPKNIPVNTDEHSEKRLLEKLESIKFEQKQNGEKKEYFLSEENKQLLKKIYDKVMFNTSKSDEFYKYIKNDLGDTDFENYKINDPFVEKFLEILTTASGEEGLSEAFNDAILMLNHFPKEKMHNDAQEAKKTLELIYQSFEDSVSFKSYIQEYDLDWTRLLTIHISFYYLITKRDVELPNFFHENTKSRLKELRSAPFFSFD